MKFRLLSLISRLYSWRRILAIQQNIIVLRSQLNRRINPRIEAHLFKFNLTSKVHLYLRRNLQLLLNWKMLSLIKNQGQQHKHLDNKNQVWRAIQNANKANLQHSKQIHRTPKDLERMGVKMVVCMLKNRKWLNRQRNHHLRLTKRCPRYATNPKAFLRSSPIRNLKVLQYKQVLINHRFLRIWIFSKMKASVGRVTTERVKERSNP